MNAAICLLLYGAALVWLSPRVLSRLTDNGASPRLSIALWLVTVALALTAWIVAGAGVFGELFTSHPAFPVRYCMDMLLALSHLGWAGHAALAALSTLALGASLVVVRRTLKALRRFWFRSREHAHAAHVIGAPTARPGVLTLEASQAAAYCVAGRPDAIVVTTGALETLTDAELEAVLAHERAHLSGRHPQLMMVLRALAASMPRLPLFRAAADSVSRLVEMSADDRAARAHGRDTLLGGLITLAGPPRGQGVSLAAADTAVLARAARLATPPRFWPCLRQRVLLTTTLSLVMGAPVVITGMGHSA